MTLPIVCESSPTITTVYCWFSCHDGGLCTVTATARRQAARPTRVVLCILKQLFMHVNIINMAHSKKKMWFSSLQLQWKIMLRTVGMRTTMETSLRLINACYMGWTKMTMTKQCMKRKKVMEIMKCGVAQNLWHLAAG